MRGGLNLTRLARSSEGKHFSELQVQQAHKLRENLPKHELEAARKSAESHYSDLTVDAVSSIAGHTAYRRLTSSERTIRKAGDQSFLLRRLQNPNQSHLSESSLQMGQVTSGPDPSVLKILSHNRAALYANAQSDIRAARPLPGSEVRAEGAVLGLQAFLTATMLVGSVGLAGIGAMYFNPGLVDAMRTKSIRFRERIEMGPLGKRLRKTATDFRGDGGLLSEETSTKAGVFARAAVGIRNNDEESERPP